MTNITRTAKISACGRYRYALTRTWDAEAGEALFVCLNPSTADGLRDDHTVRKLTGFTRRWGLGGFRIANLFAYRATKPRELHLAHKRGVDITGPLNVEHIIALAQGARCIVLAWGVHAAVYPARAESIAATLGVFYQPLWCFGVSKGGHPLHPLTLPYSTPLQNLKDVI